MVAALSLKSGLKVELVSSNRKKGLQTWKRDLKMGPLERGLKVELMASNCKKGFKPGKGALKWGLSLFYYVMLENPENDLKKGP
mmetsp:Transcript_21951/g.21230  ORF Transcript_21951/g.21230 Transcript_21951/m.21230 type:complete len:84 (+) Transcript_21951:625-876(+)